MCRKGGKGNGRRRKKYKARATFELYGCRTTRGVRHILNNKPKSKPKTPAFSKGEKFSPKKKGKKVGRR